VHTKHETRSNKGLNNLPIECQDPQMLGKCDIRTSGEQISKAFVSHLDRTSAGLPAHLSKPDNDGQVGTMDRQFSMRVIYCWIRPMAKNLAHNWQTYSIAEHESTSM
jgi:hypothetical protein